VDLATGFHTPDAHDRPLRCRGTAPHRRGVIFARGMIAPARAPVGVQSAMARLEQLDEVAGRILEQDLPSESPALAAPDGTIALRQCFQDAPPQQPKSNQIRLMYRCIAR
jgi:hypothetical protein